MSNRNRNFNIALFAVAFIICVIVGLLLMQGRSRRSQPMQETNPTLAAADARMLRALQGGESPATPGPTGAPSARRGAAPATPVPELAAPRLTPVVPATPVVRAEATPGLTIEADVEPGTMAAMPAPTATTPPPASDDPFDRALSAYQARSAAALDGPPPPATPGILGTPPAALPADGSAPGLAPGAAVPEIAVPAGLGTPTPRPAAAVATPRAARPAPTRLPIQTNLPGGPAEQFDAMAASAPPVLPDLQPGTGAFPRWGTPENPAVRQPDGSYAPLPSFGQPTPGVPEELPVEMPAVPSEAAAPPPDGAVRVGQALPATPPTPPPAFPPTEDDLVLPPLDADASAGAAPPPVASPSPSPSPRREAAKATPAAADATPGVHTIERPGAQVTFSNVHGPLRPVTTGTEASVAAPAVVPPEVRDAIGAATPRVGVATPEAAAGAAPQPGVMSNTAAPSPTPSFDPDSPAGTATPDSAAPDSDGPVLTPEQLASLPPDIAKRVGGIVRNSGVQVGERILSPDGVERRVNAAMSLRGVREAGEAERATMGGFIKQDWAEKTAIADEARRQGVDVTEADMKAYRDRMTKRIGPNFEQVFRDAGLSEQEIQDEMRASALAEKFVETAYRKQFNEQKLREVYQADPEQFSPGRRLRVMEIYRSGPDADRQMSEIQRRLSRGEDFAQVAAEASEAPSRERGGDIGWIDASTPISEEMAEALVDLTPGMVSRPVKTEQGLRILKLAEVEEPNPGFDGARRNVEAGVREVLRRAAYDTALMNTKVVIDGRIIQPGGRPERASDAPAGRARVRPRQDASADRVDATVRVGQPVEARRPRAGAETPAAGMPAGFGPPIPGR